MRKASSELLAALLLAAITFSLIAMTVIPGVKGMLKVGEGTSSLLRLSDVRERVLELIYSRVGAVPTATCSYSSRSLSCSLNFPYSGKADYLLVDNIYLVKDGVVECASGEVTQTYATLAQGVLELDVSATLPNCPYYQGVQTLVARLVLAPQARGSTVTFVPRIIPVYVAIPVNLG